MSKQNKTGNIKTAKDKKNAIAGSKKTSVTKTDISSTQNKTTVMGKEEIKKQLCEEEQKIDNGIKAFWVAAEALKKIRKLKLYNNDYKSFPEYLAARWGYSESYVSRLITAGDVREKIINDKTIENKKDKLPTGYSFYYALSRFNFDEQLEYLQTLFVDGEKLTVQKLKDLSTEFVDADKIQEQRLRTAISTFKTLAENFDPDKFFLNKSGNKSAEEAKEDFVNALSIILDKLGRRIATKTDD